MSPIFTPARKMSLLAGAVVLGLMVGGASAAQAQKKNTEPQKASNHQMAEAIHLLKSIKLTLEGADHDYGGHRAQAVKDIGQAEKQLHEALMYIHKQHAKTGSTTAKGKGTGKNNNPHPEPQKLSDAELASSVPVLHQTVVMLEKADHDYGGHRAKAVTDLKAAVTQLEKALKFSKANDKNKP